MEYALAKVCSALRVGIRVGFVDHSFDLLCYEDCIEFAMEKCQSLPNKSYSNSELTAIEKRLQYCLAVIHSFGLVHKDIKPDNLLVDVEGTVMLMDFGISAYVRERPGQKSMSYKEGTRKFMSPEMSELGRG